MKYRCMEGDVLDLICTRYYEDTPWRIEEVIAANPGLAALGPVLPAGLLIELPAVAEDTPVQPVIRLWD